ncbi:MAG: FISUMP domain-containing protein, partial [Bacteroidales bacterium]|nr:FISUMP domain-containing protein [Bacteroidales bacterium]
RLWYIPFGEWKLSVTKEQTLDYSFSYKTELLQLNEIQVERNLVLNKHSLTKEFTDPRDQHVYHYRYIGSRAWMLENLAYLPEVFPPDTVASKKAMYYVYDYIGTNTAAAEATANYQEYGVLYNRPATKTACPPGWEIPGDKDFSDLNLNSDVQGLKSESGWLSHGNGTNTSRFNALPAGIVTHKGAFSSILESTYFWSSNIIENQAPWLFKMVYDDYGLIHEPGSDKMGVSIRCVKER